MDNFKDKTVVITGGATGIGFGLAKAFGADGAKIVIAEPRENRLKDAVDALGKLGVEARYKICDVSDPASVHGLADFAWDQFGRVDVLINNAGVSSPRQSLVDLPLEQLHKVFDVNVFGVWHGCAEFGRRMIEQGTPAAIYNLASENALFCAIPRGAAYIASKHAVLGMTEAFREDMPDFIEVGAIFPGFVRSEMTRGEVAHMAMDTDQFVETVMKQIRAGEHFIVSHAFNMERVEARHQEIAKAFRTYAPRYDGDEEYDVRTIIARRIE